jgi:hypothetical protein
LKRLFEYGTGIILPREDCRGARDLRPEAAQIRHVGIQHAGHSGLVGIVQPYNVAYPSGKQKVYYFRRLQFVANRPGELFKPSPNGLEKGVWEQMNVRVYYERQRRRNLLTFRIRLNGEWPG